GRPRKRWDEMLNEDGTGRKSITCGGGRGRRRIITFQYSVQNVICNSIIIKPRKRWDEMLNEDGTGRKAITCGGGRGRRRIIIFQYS
ncbi:hypothetical protein L9F63_023463, partial [Diploptera punctata]